MDFFNRISGFIEKGFPVGRIYKIHPYLIRNAEKVGEVISTHVIARPHLNIDLVLPLGRNEEAERELG